MKTYSIQSFECYHTPTSYLIDTIEVYDWKVVAHAANTCIVWYFEDYIDIRIKYLSFYPRAEGEIVFLQNRNYISEEEDTLNSIAFYVNRYTTKETDVFLEELYRDIKARFYAFRDAKAQHYLNNNNRDE